MKTVLLITLKSKYGVLEKISHFFRYTWDKFDHVLDHHFKTIKAMKVKFCIPVKVIGIHILTINKVYKRLHFLRYLKKKKKLLYFLNYPVASDLPNLFKNIPRLFKDPQSLGIKYGERSAISTLCYWCYNCYLILKLT